MKYLLYLTAPVMNKGEVYHLTHCEYTMQLGLDTEEKLDLLPNIL